MREIIVPFALPVQSTTGARYIVRVIGHERADGIWEGVIEFQHEGSRLVTGVETMQSNAGEIEFWATGLKPVYVDEALRRARRPGTRRSVSARRQEKGV